MRNCLNVAVLPTILRYMNEESRFIRKLKETLDSGLETSRKAVNSALNKTRELEDYGVLKLDIRRLEHRSEELLKELGLVVFSQLAEEGKLSVTRKNAIIGGILSELEENRDMRDRKEIQLKNLSKK